MDDVDGGVRHLSDRNSPVDSFRLGSSGSRQSMVFGRSFSFGERALHQDINDHAILGVHTDQTTGLACCAHGLENCPVVDEKHAGIGHKQLEAGYTLIDQHFELRQPLVRKVRDDHVESVIDSGFTFCF